MYELSIACRYLLPRLRELSVSIISLISVCVIALVVWLIIVFFSATEGLETRWTERLVAITAPVRVTPNIQYYRSYYYQVDALSHSSNFQYQSIAEKLQSHRSDPYDPEQDPPLPYGFPQKTIGSDGQPLDIIKTAFQAISSIPNVSCKPFETAFATAKIRLIRQDAIDLGMTTQELVSQAAYLVNWDKENSRLQDAILPFSERDLQRASDRSLLFNEKMVEASYQSNLPQLGDPILLPKSFKDAGIEVMDTGNLLYQVMTPTGLQEQKCAVYVSGFYDPGIIPIGGRIILAAPQLVSEIRGSTSVDSSILPTGLNVYCANLSDTHPIKSMIQKRLEEHGVGQYFDVQAYDEYDFTKDVFTQLKSEKNLFSLISLIIIVVACSNIVSMLVILVHDKAKEIAILRALGATKTSIALIFGLSGLFMGATGSVIGSIAAYWTVKNLSTLLYCLGQLQGFDVLNAAFYGTQLPTDVSTFSFVFVIIATGILSMISGLVPAIRACRQNTSEALRSE